MTAGRKHGRDAKKHETGFTTSLLFVAALVVFPLCLSSCQPLSTKKNSPSATNAKAAEKAADKQPDKLADETPNVVANSSDSSNPIRKKIPTLREQMERLQSQQEQMNSRLDTMQSELHAIKQKVDERASSDNAGSEKNNADKKAQQEFVRGESPKNANAATNPGTSATKNATPKSSADKSIADKADARDAKSAGTTNSDKAKKPKSSGLILPDDDAAPAGTASKATSDKATSKSATGASKKSKDADTFGNLIKADQDNTAGDEPKASIPKVKKRTPRPKAPETEKIAAATTPAKSGAAPAKTAQATQAAAPTKAAPATAAPTKSAQKEPQSQLDAAMNENPAGKAPIINPLFNTATNLFAKKQYQEAIDVLNQVCVQDKNPDMINRAQYWIGESYFGLAKYDDAIRTFNKVLAAKSNEKSSKAMSMIAESMIRLGQTAEAKKTYQRLLKQFPQSEEAVKASKRLQQL